MSSPGGQVIGGMLPLLLSLHLLAAPRVAAASSSELVVETQGAPDMVAGAVGPEPDAWPVSIIDGGELTPATSDNETPAGAEEGERSDDAASDPSEATRPPPPMSSAFARARRDGVSWDLQVEIGGPVWANTWGDLFEPWLGDLWEVIKFNKPGFTAFARVRVGFLVLKEPWYFGAGVTAGYGGIGGAAVGLQTDLTNIWGGLWIQGGAEWNEDHGLVLSAGGGYQVIGGEWRVYDGGRNIALLAKIRLPFGLVAFVKGVYDKRK